jgi:predicted peptidase
LRTLVLALALAALIAIDPPPALAAARTTDGTFEATLSRHVALPYRVWLPAGYDSASTWPTILFLHGSGERGTDLAFVARNGPPRVAQERGLPFVVIAPQLPAGETWSADAVLALLERLEAALKIDTTRVYLTGLSMGAYGAYEAAIAAPTRFAALMTVSGAGNPVEVCKLAGLPTWVVHGAKDDIIPVDWGREMAKRLAACKGEVRLTLEPDAGHDAWTKVYDDPATYEWFLAHRRAVIAVVGAGASGQLLRRHARARRAIP